MTKRIHINIPINDLGKAVRDKDYMCALSLWAQIKLCYRSSVLKDASIRKVMRFAGIGYGRAKAALEKGIKDGLFSFVGNDLYASKLFEGKRWHYYKVYCRFNQKATTGKTRCGLSIAELSREIRKGFLLNHHSKNTECSDTINGFQNGLIAPSSRKGKMVRSMSDRSATCQIGNKRAASIIGVSVPTLRKLTKELIKSGDLIKTENIKLLSETLLSPELAVALSKKMQVEKGIYGHVFAKQGKLYIYLPNSYRCVTNKIGVKYA